MATSIANASVSIEEYLHNPAYEHCEYVDGEIQELNVGTRAHGFIQLNLGAIFRDYFKTRPGNYAGIELHCRLRIGGRIRFRLPDIAVVLGDFTGDYLERGPDLAVEIRSPDDSVWSQICKMDDYFANGTRLGWLIVPEDRSVLVLQPGKPIRTVRAGETLDGGDLLPGLAISVADLFA